MSMDASIRDLTVRIATECKSIRSLLGSSTGDLGTLTTATKTNLVAALNELKGLVSGTIADATTGTGSTWSSQKIADQIAAAKNAILNGASDKLDTLAELAAALNNDANFASTVTTAIATTLKIDGSQTLTAAQKTSVIASVGCVAATDVGSTTTDYVGLFNTGLS